MAWKDPRGSGSAVVAVARTTAHRDDAKARTDDASAAARRGFPRKLLVGGGALVLVAGAVVFAVSQSGEDGGTTPLAVAAAADPTSAAPSASEDPEPTPEEILAGSVPTGKWKMVQTFKYSIQRNGQRSQSWSYDPINADVEVPAGRLHRGRLLGLACAAAAAAPSSSRGTGSGWPSASGARRSAWPRQACVDTDDGRGACRSALSAVRRTYHVRDIPAFRGTAVPDGHGHGDPRDPGVVRRLRVKAPLDVVRLYERRVMTPK